jgi:hypothetical protein
MMSVDRNRAQIERSLPDLCDAVASWENEGGAPRGSEKNTERDREQNRFVPLLMFPVLLMGWLFARLASRSHGS